MKVAFKDDDSFAFEFVRNLGFMYYGGADLGEMIATAGRIADGDFETWFTEWDGLAHRILARADASLRAGHPVSAREGYLRASTYFRMAEFYLYGDPADPRILSASRASQRSYAEAAKLSGPTWEPVEVPYEGTTLPGYFYKVDDSGEPRPTLIYHGGYDSSAEELFFFFAAAANRHGYNCLTFDGPGQGAPLREHKLPFRHDWEKVVTPVVNYVLTRPDVDGKNLVLLGMSLGGLWAARAAAFEHRLRAAVFFDGVYDLHESLEASLPEEALSALASGETEKGEEIIRQAMNKSTSVRWSIENGVWTFGASGIADFISKTRLHTVKDVVQQIQCSCLVLEAKDDMFFARQPRQVYDALQSPKSIFVFESKDGAENHCQSGALAYLHEVVFNWLDETLGLNGGYTGTAHDEIALDIPAATKRHPEGHLQ